MPRGKLFFCVGNARSGKSTVCDRWVNEAMAPPKFLCQKDGMKPRVVIGGDDFRTALHGMTYLPESEPHVFAAMDTAIRALLNRGFDVIVDETCTTELTLRRYLGIDLQATPIFIDTPVGICKERAMFTGKYYLLGPIDRMAVQLAHLRANWDEIHARLCEYVKVRMAHDNHC